MAVELANAYVNITPETSSVGPAINQMVGAIGTGGKKGGSLFSAGLVGGIAGGMASLVGGAITGGLASIKSNVTEMVSSFSDLEDSTGAASVVFGDSMDQIIAQSENAAATMGMTKAQVIEAANTFGTFGKAAGLTGNDLAGFSTQMTSLAGDLASFKGTTPEQAITAIGAAMRGESEPIRQYGILLDDATLKNRALEMGLISTTNQALTPQQKTLAAQAEIMAQASDATGDFARTSDSTANVQKRFTATLTNFQATVGGAIAPAFTMLRSAATSALEGMDSALQGAMPRITAFWSGASEKFTAGLNTIRNTVGTGFADLWSGLTASGDTSSLTGLAQVGATIREVFDQLAPTFQTLLPQVMELAGAFSPVKLIFNSLVPILPQIGQAFSAIAQALSGALAGVLPVITDTLSTLAGVLSGTIADILPTVVNVVVMLVDVVAQILPALAPLLGQLVSTLLPVLAQLVPPIGEIVMTLVSALMPVIQALMPVFGTLVGVLGQIITAITPLLPPILNLVGVLLDALLPLLPPLGDLIATVATMFVDLLAALAPLLPAITNMIGAGINVLIAVLTPLIHVISLVANILITGLTAAIKVVMPVINGVISIVTTFASTLTGVVSRAINKVTSVVQGAFNKAFNTTQRVWSAMRGIVSGVTSAIGRFVSSMASNVRSVITGLGSRVTGIFRSMWNDARSAASDGVGGIIRFVATMPSRVLKALGNVGSYLISSGASLINGFKQGIMNAFSSVKNAVSGGLSSIRNLFPFSPAKEGPFSGKGWVLYSGLSIGPAMAQGIQKSIPDAVSAAEDLTASTRSALNLDNLAGTTWATSAAAANQRATGVNGAGVTQTFNVTAHDPEIAARVIEQRQRQLQGVI